MGKIDSKMQQQFQTSISEQNGTQGQCNAAGATVLIDRAHEINDTSHSSSCRKRTHNKAGTRSLETILHDNPDKFTQDSADMINKFLKSGSRPVTVTTDDSACSSESGSQIGEGTSTGRAGFGRGGMPHTGTSHTVHGGPSVSAGGTGRTVEFGTSSSMGRTGGHVGNTDAMGDRGRGVSGNTGGRGGASDAGGTSSGGRTGGRTNNAGGGGDRIDGHNRGTTGTTGAANGRPAAGSTEPTRPEEPRRPAGPTRPSDPIRTDPVSPTLPSTPVGAAGPYGRVILDMRSPKQTFTCHWFPIQDRGMVGGDSVNNLFGAGGPLDKYDRATGAKSRDHELRNNRKAMDAGAEYGWWGHCDKAATTACLLNGPKHPVTYNGVAFTENDIQGLLVKVIENLSGKVDFRGNRFNNRDDDLKDPKPEVFLKAMQDWQGTPYVMDTDRNAQVWNFPYDQGTVYESDTPPQGVVISGLPSDGSVKYYRADLAGTGYDSGPNNKKKTYGFYIQRDSSGKVLASDWIEGTGFDGNPDFLWRPEAVGDLTKKEKWIKSGRQDNPQVDPQVVYDIYMQSLA